MKNGYDLGIAAHTDDSDRKTLQRLSREWSFLGVLDVLDQVFSVGHQRHSHTQVEWYVLVSRHKNGYFTNIFWIFVFFTILPLPLFSCWYVPSSFLCSDYLKCEPQYRSQWHDFLSIIIDWFFKTVLHFIEIKTDAI